MNRNKLRNAFRTIHLWMGLASGLVLFVVCLTGTIYTFRSEIERWLEPAKYYFSDTGGNKILEADALVVMIEKKFSARVTSVTVPGNKEMNWQVSVKKEGKEAKPNTYFVNPYTGSIAGEQGGSTNEFFTTVMHLHRWLLMGESTGRIIVGIATIIMFFMVLTGLILWFPAKLRHWKQGLKIKTSANWKRVNHDLHNALGFYAFTLLIIMTLTGLCWSFEWYRNGLSDVLGSKVFKGRGEKPFQSKQATAGGPVSASILLSHAGSLFPYEGNSRLSIPEDSMAAATVTKSATGFFSVAGVDRVHFDRFSGEAIKIERFSDKPLNTKIADSIKLIHTGEIFGIASKILYFLACLIATSLPVTGTLIWLNKMKKKPKQAKIIAENAREFA